MKIKRDWLGKKYTIIAEDKLDDKALKKLNNYIDKLEEENKALKITVDENNLLAQDYVKLKEENKNMRKELCNTQLLLKAGMDDYMELEEKNKELEEKYEKLKADYIKLSKIVEINGGYRASYVNELRDKIAKLEQELKIWMLTAKDYARLQGVDLEDFPRL